MNNEQRATGNIQFLFTGEIVDCDDPKKLGRYRVDIHGANIKNKDALPWSIALMPVTSASMHGIGDTPYLNKGSWVVGLFIDADRQVPVIIGSIQSLSSDGEPDLHRLAGGIIDKTSAEQHNKNQIRGTIDFDEPAIKRAPAYGNNRVISSRSGHTIELDDTGGAERIAISHSSGAFIEIGANGSIVIKSPETLYLAAKDIKMHSTGYARLTNGLSVHNITQAKFNIGGAVGSMLAGAVEFASSKIKVSATTTMSLLAKLIRLN